ncbi:MAG: molybdenum cofactor guanylyltransferase [Bacteroidetes bacterium]|nr:molybdenum cofactor guanylyltransferase [Bacteroidota bacterium]
MLLTVLDEKVKPKFGSAIILAGGQSKRMGFDKQFINLHGKRLLHLLIKKLKKEFDEIILVTDVLEPIKGVKIISDILKNKGPLGGIHVGLKNAKSQYAYVVACDLPTILLEDIKLMKTKLINNEDVCLFKNQPLHAFYSTRLVDAIENYLLSDLNYSLKLFIKPLKIAVINKNHSIINLNTPNDLKNFLALK